MNVIKKLLSVLFAVYLISITGLVIYFVFFILFSNDGEMGATIALTGLLQLGIYLIPSVIWTHYLLKYIDSLKKRNIHLILYGLWILLPFIIGFVLYF